MRTQPKADRRRIILYATLGVIVIAFIGVIGYFSRTGAPESSKAPTIAALKPGDAAPDFALSTTQGEFELSKSRDKPTLLEVFATWCPHCQRETIVLNAIYDANKSKMHFVAVNGSSSSSEMAEVPETQADVVGFGQRFGVRYPIAFDEDLTVANHYLLGGFPTLVLIGTDGKILAENAVEVPQENLQKALDAAYAGKKPDAGFGVTAATS